MLDSFKTPPPEHRMHALWQWNSHLDADEVERQIREMRKQHFGGFVVEHGPDIMAHNSETNLLECLDRAARTARSLGMRAFVHNPADGFNAPKGQDWSKFLYLLGHKSRTDSGNSTATKNLNTLGEFANEFWGVPMEEVKRAVDWQMSLGGFTMLAPRTPYALDCPEDDKVQRFYDAPSWPYQRLLADYTSRLSYSLSQGKGKSQVALLEPSPRRSSTASEVSTRYVELYCQSLLRQHIAFDIITEQALADATCVDQTIAVDGTEYQALIMPPMTKIRPRAARKIRDFAEDGGVIVGTGLLPYATSQGAEQSWIRNAFLGIFNLDPLELEHKESQEDIDPQRSENNPVIFFAFGKEADIAGKLRHWLESVIRLDVSVQWRSEECEDIMFAHKVLENGDIFFFANNSAEPREVQLAIRCTGAPHLLDPETGESSALANCTQRAGRTFLLHRFERFGSLLVYFGSEPALRVRRTISGIEGREVALLDTWSCVADDGNRSTICRAGVQIPQTSKGESVVLRACDPTGVVEFTVNDIRAGVRAWAPYEVDITHLVSIQGDNMIEIRDVDVSQNPNGPSSRTARVAIC